MSAIDSFNARLDAGEIILMDGGTGTEINRRGVPVDPNTWSGAAMLAHPDVIRDIHEDYLRAGADIIITNTFCTSRATLELAGLGKRTAEANNLAVKLAKEAVEAAAPNREIVVAGSMSTFIPKAMPDVIPSYDAALEDYREQAHLLAEAGVDVIVAEMIIRRLDARAAVEAINETGLPAWVGFSSVDNVGHQYLGMHGAFGADLLTEAVAEMESMGVSALFTMHSSLEDTGLAMRELRETATVPIGAYAHTRFAKLEELKSSDPIRYDLLPSPEGYLEFAREWVDLGARIVGGCCGTTPDHIKALKEGLLQKIPA